MQLARPSAARAERRAWVVIWLAFATFCVASFAGLQLVSQFVTGSQINFQASVENNEGVVFVQGDGLGGESRLTGAVDVGSTIFPQRASSATLRFFNGTRMTALADSRVKLTRMDVGRFINRQSVVLTQSLGPVRYEVTSPTTVAVPGGTVQASSGDMTVWVESSGATQVLVYGGAATLQVGDQSTSVPDGSRGEISADHTLSPVLPRTQDLLQNGDFSAQTSGWQPYDKIDGPNDVDGQRSFIPGPVIDGQPFTALQVVRQSVTLAHGETGLRQNLDLDVSGYRHLYVTAWVRVDSASLSGGGQLGSEYPMMLSVDYEASPAGSRPNWVHGFYAANPDHRPVDNAEQLPTGTWAHYQADLMDVDQDRQPFRLIDMTVMGQGHSFDASVADVQIIGD